MTPALFAAAILAALPVGAARYRVELSGVPLGAADLAVRCAGEDCTVRFESRLRLPAESGGAVRVRRVTLPVGPDGVLRGAGVLEETGRPARRIAGPTGLVPATAAELLLAARGVPACVDAFDEDGGARGRACVVAGPGAPLRLEVLGELLFVRAAPGALPSEVAIPSQGVRFVADPAAAVPPRPPPIAGTEVPGPATPEGPLVFCGVRPDPPPPPAPAGAPEPRAPGASCREKTAAYLSAVRAAGLEGRTAVGVAWDGGAFVWHAWAEVRDGSRWVPVDPSFAQRPARGPRFTLARWRDGDETARLAAGRRILACWGHARVDRR